MRTLLIWLAGCCAIFFVATLCASLPLISAEILLFDPETYKRAFDQTNLYGRMPKLLAELRIISLDINPCQGNPLACLPPGASPLRTCLERELTAETFSALSSNSRRPTPQETEIIDRCAAEFGPFPAPETRDSSSYLKFLTAQDRELLIATLVPPKQMKLMTEQALDEVFAYLNGKVEQANFDLRPFKQSLKDNGVETTRQILAAQPDCTKEQLLDLTANLTFPLPGEVQVLCNPPQDVFELMRPKLQSSLQTEVEKMPNSLPFLDKTVLDLTSLILARFITRLSLLLPLSFFILMTLLAVRSLSGWLGWWGIPFVSAGGLLTFLALISALLTRVALAATVGPTAYADSAVLAGVDVIQAIIVQVILPVGIAGSVLLVIGAGMLLGRYFILKKREQDEEFNGSVFP